MRDYYVRFAAICQICSVAAEPRSNNYPAVIGAAIGGMLFAAVATVLLLMYIFRNRNNNPRESHSHISSCYS